MEEGYPGNLRVQVDFYVNTDGIELLYTAQSDKDTVINLTNHTYFNLSEGKENIVIDSTLPGIWVSPHAVSKESDVYKNHKDWLVKTFSGEIHPANALDFSHPKAKKWLYDLFKKLTDEYGYEYIKVDLIAPVMCAGKYYDENFNSLKNYRESLKIIREAVGRNVFILVCTAPIMASVGLADGVRTSVDIFERYQSLLNVFSRSLNRCYLNDKSTRFIHGKTCVVCVAVYLRAGNRERYKCGQKTTASRFSLQTGKNTL